MTAPKWWDFTLPRDKWELSEIIERLENNGADRFAIGDEIGDGGYKHWQGRVVFKVEKEMTTVCNLLGFVRGKGDADRWGNVSPTHVRDFEYVKKGGKFYCSWEGALRPYQIVELRDWQAQVEIFFNNQNDRQIMVVYDERGNQGKSFFSKYMEATHQADVCPVTDGEASNYIEYCMNHPARGYIFDVPRADTVKGKKNMWKAIEQIKNGLLYDRRYTSRKMWITPPKILVFANELPESEMLSADRWQLFRIENWGKEALLMPAEGCE